MNSEFNILLVDDKVSNLDALEAILDRSDINIIRAESGFEALETALKKELALILLDIQMPGMDGYETAELLRKTNRTKNIPLIFITAINKEKRHVFQGYNLGAVDFLFKPIEPVVIRSKVNVFLELYRQRRELENNKKELEDFSYAVSHDLKAPLVSIKGFAQLLHDCRGNCKPEKCNKYLGRIIANCDNMNSLLQDLAKLVEIGKIEYQPNRINMTSIIREVIENIDTHSSIYPVNIKLNDNIPEVYGQVNRVKEVITNLVDNALKYMPDKPGAEIEIGFGKNKSPSADDRPVFYVRDNGAGIPKEYHNRIFEMFQRFVTPGDQVQGSGAGLAIVKKIIEDHGGKIWLDSEFGQGTAFYFDLPLYHPQSNK